MVSTTLEQALAIPGDGIRCTSAVIFNEEGKILLGLRHYKKKWEGELIANSLWTTPGGRTDEGEMLGDCLKRESLEETGLQVTPVEYLGELPGAREGDALHIFRCKYSGNLKNMEPEKFGSWEWFLPEEIPGNFINPHVREMLLNRS